MSGLKKITYTHLVNNIYHHPRDIESRELLLLLKQMQAIPQQLLPFKGIIHLIDYTRRSHIALSGEAKNMVGYSPEEVIGGGLDFIMNIFHKDDFKIYNETIFPKVTGFLHDTPQEEHSNYIFSYGYRMKKPDGKWLNLFQQGSYITDPLTKLPLYGIALVTDITPLKKDSSMIFAIDKKLDGTGNLLYGTNIFTEHYFPNPDDARLSAREREILALLAQGFSSKQIADTLHLSENTIVNHRKNILKKTNTKNSAELINYGKQKGLI